MILEIKIPSPGESITEAQLSNWLVSDGDYVMKDQEIAEVESDKATLPLIASEDGQVKFLAKAGDTVKIGSVACTIDTSIAKPLGKSQEPRAKSQETAKNPEPVSSNQQPVTSNQQPVTSSLKVSPVAQKMMEENHLSVEDILNGLKRIGKSEVETVLNAPAFTLTTSEEKRRDEERKKMTPLRKKLAERLVAVKNQTAMLTTFNEIDMSAVMELRKKYQKEFETTHGIKIGFMSFFTKAVASALKLHPNVNSMIDGEDIVTPGYYDVAIAVQSDKGLVVPVLRNVETMTLADIERGIAGLAAKARAGRISIEDMTGGTFTITNGGVFGSLLSTPIINPPQSAILGMHNIVERPVAVNGQVVIRPMMYVALSYDHRIIDGKDSVGFLVHVKQFIENPVKMLFDGHEPEKVLLGI
jgi:2-oxoglutarate dehydrogenase E2 component (dihydrolipoamide succinyltransferase)